MKRHLILTVSWLLFANLFAAHAQHLVTDELIWIEGEQPDKTQTKFHVSQSARPHLLSDGKMLLINYGHKNIPKDGLELTYRFNIKRTDQYAFWIRLGYEWVRAPFAWRIDHGPWQQASANVQTTQVMELATWNEIAWANYGHIKFKAGQHKLTLRFADQGIDGRMLIGIDCIAFGRKSFNPALMYHVPKMPIDQQAANQVYQLNLSESLNGLWQVARFDDPDMDQKTYEPLKQLPELNPLRWLGLQVPGQGKGAWAQREELSFGHRLLYRTRVQIPQQSQSQSYVLNFEATNWIASVFINGKLANTHKSVLVPWSCDVTDHIIPGKINEIIVAIKSPWYAINVKANKGRTRSLDHARNTPAQSNFSKNRSYVAPVFPATKGQGNGLTTGIMGSITLAIRGKAYVEDVFVQPKIKPQKQLAIEITLTNPSNKNLNLQWTGKIIDTITKQPLNATLNIQTTINAGQTKTLELSSLIPNAKLWWPENHAQLYELQSTLIANGKVIDQHQQTFGFRETSIDGKIFLLNGIPWRFWNWAPGSFPSDQKAWLENYHAQNNRFHRISNDHDKIFGSRKNALQFFDQQGIPGRLSTCIDGMFITHDLNNPLVWENFEQHVRQTVKAYRNHPSIMMYSLGNEMMFVTGFLKHRNNYRAIEQKMAKLSAIAKELDPGRISFQDGGGDLGGLGEVNCQHYTFPKGSTFPSQAYDYPTGPYEPNRKHTRSEVFKWSGKNPLILGEVFYYAGNLSKMAWVGGSEVYRGRQYANMAAGKYLNLAIQGARWQGVTAICPWTKKLPGVEPAMQSRAVFVKQHNASIYPNSQFTRDIKIFNDTRFDNPIKFSWQLLHDKTVISQGNKTYDIKAGHAQQDKLTINTPQAFTDMTLTLRLTLTVQGKQVFEDTHNLFMLFKEPVKQHEGLVVYDPKGKVSPWLIKNRIAHRKIHSLDTNPNAIKTLLIGPNALTDNQLQDAGALIGSLSKQGKNIIVLEQSTPITGRTLGVKLDLAGKNQDAQSAWRAEFEGAKGSVGQIAFIASPAHPIFKNIHNDQLFTWAKGSWNFTNSYASPTGGMLPLINAGHDLNLCPMVQINLGKGHVILSQMLIGTKLGIEPVADRLLGRLLEHAQTSANQQTAKTVVMIDGDNKLENLLKETGLQFKRVNNTARLLKLTPTHKVMIVKATAKNMAWLKTNDKIIKHWANQGGKLMLVNLTAKGLADFNLLVGFPHQIRTGTQERVQLANRANPLLLGISDRDLAMNSEKYIARWKHQFYVSDRVFSHVIDADEMASFAKLKNQHRNMVNGLTNNDFWRYITYLHPKETVRFDFAHVQPLDRIQLWTNNSYKVIKRIRIIFDDNPSTAMNINLQDTPSLQIIPINRQTAETLDIQLLEMFDQPATKNLTGIDNIQIFRKLPDELASRFTMLASPGGLVYYPLGNGGILLNNLDYQKPDTEVNRKKKLGVWSNLLRNMGTSTNH